MIEEYRIHNFKNHADTKLQLSHLTLFSGMNGAGKSSVIQSMLLLRDTYIISHQISKLYLRGNSFTVGLIADAVNYNCKEDKERLRIGLKTDTGKEYKLSFKYSDQAETTSLSIIPEESLYDSDMFSISLFTDKFQYLSAFRNGPMSSYDSDKELVDVHHQLSRNLGCGEMTVYYLSKFGEDPLFIDSLCHNKELPHTLRFQTISWLNEICKGIQIQINQYSSQYELNYGIERRGKKTIFHSAINTGYGISYALSIIVAILSSKPGSLILIENPEAHIHPAGQSSLMRLITMAAKAGVQIVMETHSDHIINGALVASKQNKINKKDISIYFFDRDGDCNARPIKLVIGENGLIQDAPADFFGQMNDDLKVLYDL